MAYAQHIREHHRRRLALRLTRHWPGRWSLIWRLDSPPALFTLVRRSHRLHSRQAACNWATAQPDGTHYQAYAVHGSSRPTCWYAALYDAAAPHRRSPVTDASERRQADERLARMKRETSRGSLKGGLTGVTRVHRRRRRAAARHAAHLTLRGHLDAFDDLHPRAGERGILRELW